MYRVTALSRAVVAACLAISFPFLTNQSAQAQGAERSWAGFYIGAHGAYVSAETDYINPSTPSQTLEGAMLGLQVGYNWQVGRVVLGAEADVSFGKVNDFIRDGNFLTEDGDLRAFGSVRARIGYSFGNFLPYITGGLMWARLEQGITCPAAAAFGDCVITGAFDVRSTETLTGWIAGGGAEYAINNNWSLKAEVLVGKFQSENYTGTVPVVGKQTTPVDVDLNYTAKIGINYRF
jgi:outer membrane immunogenic protein